MAIIDKKQKRWYSKSTFDSLDKTTIPVGTEIQVAGELGQADFDSDTNTKLNAVPNKLNKPSGNPTEDSLVKVSSTGSVEYVTYKKYYKHTIEISTSTPVSIIIYAILSHNNKINTIELLIANANLLSGSNATVEDFGAGTTYNAVIRGVGGITDNYYLDLCNHNGFQSMDISGATVSDSTPIEL